MANIPALRSRIRGEKRRTYTAAAARGARRPLTSASAQAGEQAAAHDVLGAPGRPLEGGTRALLERRFEHDFSGVRVHTDAQAAESAQSLDALAYTVGRNVVFGAGQYAPHTPAGQTLLAHELTHVVQQGAARTSPGAALPLGALDDPLEREARQAAAGILQPARGSGPVSHSGPRVQRQPASSGSAGPTAPPLLPALNLPASSVDVGASEAISQENPHLVGIAEAFKSAQSGSPGSMVELSAYLSQSARLSSAREAEERTRLAGRMSAIREVLQSLGVPREQIRVQLPTVYATTATGQVAIRVYRPSANLLQPSPLSLGQAPGKATPPAPAAPGGPAGASALSDLLTLKYGPLTVELPKSLALKIPIPVSTAKTLTIDLKAEAPGAFSFAITIDGLAYVRIMAKAGLEYDKDKGLAGSAGLQIQLVSKVLNAPNPEALRAKITAAGGKLTKAMQEYKTETDEVEKLSKLADVASALGEMYDAVEAAKSPAKPTPAAILDLGVKGPLGSQTETDPAKRHPSYIGATLSIPF